MKRILLFLLLLPAFSFAQLCADEDTVRANAVTLITYNSARVNGTTGHFSGTVLSISLKYVRVGQTDTATSTSAGVNALRNITGLQANTLYVYYYISTCGSGTVKQSVAYTFTTLANTVNYTPMAAMGYQFKYLKADSGLMAPRRDTTIGRAPDYGGQIVWKPEDSTFYGYNGEYWHPLAIDSAGIISLLNDKVDSVTVAGDSLWYWKSGVSYGYILPTQANEWKLVGNSGTTAGTNFVGTTDAVDLVLKSNAIERMRWNTSGALGLGGGTNYGTNGMFLQTTGNGGPPTWSESVTMANIGAVPNGAGATFSAGTLTLQPASSTFGGVVSSTTQTFTGVKTFASNIGIAGNAGASGDNQLIFGGNSTTFRRIYGSNSNAGNGAGVGMVLQNDVGNTFQYSFNSFLNLYTPDGVYIRTNGTGGYRFSHDGAGSKVRWSTSNAVGIESGAYLGWDANEFYHIAIPQAASTSAKTVLLYDTASGGYFSQISLDSIGGSGGAVAWNAITSPTADQALTFDAGESSTWTDANTTEDLFTVNSSTGTTNSMFSLNRTGTALASGNNILELVSSGANGTNAITATGARISVTNTNATSGTNVGLAVTASGATTANYAIQATGAVVPGTNDGSAIGNTTLQWSDLFLAEGGVINWDNGDATLTQAGNTLTLAGADLALTGTGAAGATTMSITNNVNGVAGFSVTNTSTGTAAQIQNRLTNNAGDLAYYGVSGSNYSGYAPLNSGKAFFGGYQKAVSIFTQTAHGIEFYPNAVERVRISAAGNILLAGTADPTSAIGTLGIFNGTAPTASIANGTILYSEDVAASSELKVRDEAGNITVLSPHNFSQLGKPSEDLAWSYYSEKDGKYITVDMAKAIRVIEDLSARVEKLEKELGVKSTPAVKLLYKGKVKNKK